MREPVLLPTSGQVCDFNTIKRHLLNDEHDPFNRAPLKLTDLREVPELKARVARWIQQKLAGEVTDEDIKAGKAANG
jgi:ubiquitin conjugation factor E4 B